MVSYYKFSCDKKYYLYDTATSYLIELSKAIYKILDDFVEGNTLQQILFKYKTIEKQSVRRAYNEIKKFKKKYGILQNKPFNSFKFTLSEQELKSQFRNEMSHVILNVTDDCNYRCIYCKYGDTYLYEQPHSQRHMSFDIARKSIDFLLEHSRKSDEIKVGFYGGEPLLKFDLIKAVVSHIKSKTDKTLKFSITSNGSLANREIVDFLVENNFKLTLSLDGPQQIHDRYRKNIGGSGTHSRVMKAIQTIKEIDKDYYDKNVAFSAVITPPFDLLRVNDFFRSNEVNNQGPIFANLADYFDTDFYEQFPKSVWKDYRNQKNKLRNDFRTNIRNKTMTPESLQWSLFGDKAVKLHSRPTGLNSNYLYPLGICIPGVHVIFIDTEGDFYICERMGKHLCIGSAHSGFNISRIVELINRFIDVVTKHGCMECSFVRICPSCFVDAKRDNYLSMGKFKQSCSAKKQGITERLHDYAFIIDHYPDLLEKYAYK